VFFLNQAGSMTQVRLVPVQRATCWQQAATCQVHSHQHDHLLVLCYTAVLMHQQHVVCC
jgi:hypothetical protein